MSLLPHPIIFGPSSPYFRADIILGRPGAGCRYHGICRIDPPGSISPKGCRGTRVQGWVRCSKAGVWELLVRRGQLAAREEAYHFGRGTMRVHRGISLSGFVPGEDVMIREGEYPLVNLDSYHQLSLVASIKVMARPRRL